MKEDNNTSDKLKECFSKLAETNKIPQQKPNPNTQVILFKHQLKSIKWENNKYILKVEPRQSGLQIIFYNKTRRDLWSKNHVLIEVVDTNGRKLGSCFDEFSCRI